MESQSTDLLLLKASQLPPAQHEAFQEAMALLADGELEEALERSRLLLCEDGEAPLFWMLEGRVRAACMEFQAAQRSFRRACHIAPQEPAPLLERAALANALGQHPEAAQWSQRALTLATQPAERTDALLCLAEADLALLQQRMALLLEEGHEQGDAPDATLPSDELLAGWLEEGSAAVDEALQLAPKAAELWELKANYCRLSQDRQGAIKAWREAHRLAPQEPHVLHELALALEETRDFAGAHEHYRKLHSLSLHHDQQDDFFFDEFAELVAQAWEELSEELLPALDVALPFHIVAEDFPPIGMLEEAPRDAPFDPWVGMSMLAIQQDDGSKAVRIALYQRNIVRDAATDDAQELFSYIYELLEDTLLYLDSIMNDDQLS